jgi:transcriptional regulator
LTSPFERFDPGDVVDLIGAYPLASVITCSGEPAVSALPILVETDENGRPASLLGHMPRNNPQVPRIREQPRTLFLFSGPQGYVSPQFVTTSRTWAPTWNFAVVRILGDVTFDDDLTDEALQKLVQHMEQGRHQPWSTSEMGERYRALRERVIGFRSTIVTIEARFKLGQDEQPEVLESILDHLGGNELAQWMRRFNPPTK